LDAIFARETVRGLERARYLDAGRHDRDVAAGALHVRLAERDLMAAGRDGAFELHEALVIHEDGRPLAAPGRPAAAAPHVGGRRRHRDLQARTVPPPRLRAARMLRPAGAADP